MEATIIEVPHVISAFIVFPAMKCFTMLPRMLAHAIPIPVIGRISTQGFKNTADICILKGETELDPHESKTHVPNLPEG